MKRIVVSMVWMAGLAFSGSGLASTPITWEHPRRPATAGAGLESRAPATAIERDGQRAEAVAVDHQGALTLSSPIRQIFPGSSALVAPPILWTSTMDPGGALYVGTANTGEVFRIDRKGTAARHLDTDEMGVRALASGRTGTLYAGTFPNGAVYRVKNTEQPETEPFFDLEDRYVWALAVDAADRAYVGTGERGIIYRVETNGEGVPFFDTDEAHVTSLVLERSGSLLAGTASSGLLYRISPEGKGQVLLESGLSEISAIAVTPEGVVYAAASGAEQIQPARRPGDKSDWTIEVTPAPAGSILEEPADLPRKITIDLADLLPVSSAAGTGVAGRIYRIAPDRPATLVWKSDTERVYALAYTAGAGLLFGTGGGGTGASGRLYALRPDGTATLLNQFEEAQVTSLLANPDGRLYACTSNPGHVYLVEPGSAPSGTDVSPVYDARHTARGGSMGWEAEIPPGTRVEITTRSGNRPSPDASWSAWSGPYAKEGGSPIGSPAGRYLQWRAELSRLKTEVGPTLRRVKVTLLPDNRPPSLEGVTVGPAAVWPGRGPESSRRVREDPSTEERSEAVTDDKNAQADLPKGSRRVTWISSDPDGDDLSYTIWIRRPGGDAPLLVADNVRSSPYTLRDADLEEGIYTLRIQVDDALSNGPERLLTADATSDRFAVDRTPPKIDVRRLPATDAAAGRRQVELSATDLLSPIAGAEASSGPATLFCRDGICDTSAESFLVDEPPAGKKVRVRVLDAAGNEAVVELPGGDLPGAGPSDDGERKGEK